MKIAVSRSRALPQVVIGCRTGGALALAPTWDSGERNSAPIWPEVQLGMPGAAPFVSPQSQGGRWLARQAPVHGARLSARRIPAVVPPGSLCPELRHVLARRGHLNRCLH